ncbi:DAK2 domain-containing protein [Tindallia californiensis]|uniref:DhaL domain-containing protein n=1 Tax=Tindallia californiensis TaxID=159292 RepID=A0A1H3IKV7_9FIRM|nr:DegV family protein [Tindallia californiensis]SDY28015.1 hypothetical protein SAMN05192546_101187 [Tindallia californiensis]
MKVYYLNGKRVYYAMMAGARKVSCQRQHLNHINVFPVADGDTGNNLSITLNHILEEVKPQADVNQLFESIAAASLTGARGNSGMILAQFLNGLAEEVKSHKEISAGLFGESLMRSVPYAYQAMANPVEGTMLTVLKEWAESFYEFGKNNNDFGDVLIKSLDRARESLRKTPEKLEVLKKESVVDSGAQGFVHFLEGIAEVMSPGKIKALVREKRTAESIDFPEERYGKSEIDYRYCTEGYLDGSQMSIEEIKDYLTGKGDSVIVAGNSKRLRFHFHTDHPEDIFIHMSRYGVIKQQKVDDMKRQQDAMETVKPSIAIVTDSIADIPQTLMDQYHIHLLPLQMLVGATPYLDRVTITPEQIFSFLEKVKEYPTSSQPTVTRIRETLDFLVSHYEQVLVLTVSGNISGTYQAVLHEAEKYNESKERIAVIDTLKNSGAQGLLVLSAAEAVQNGKNFEEVKNMVKSLIPKTYIFVSVATFEYMVRGGRVSPMKGKLAKWLNLKPIVSLDEMGKGVAFAKAFSRKANTGKIMEIVDSLHQGKSVKEYCIVHGDAPDKAEEYRQKLVKILGKEPKYITGISPVVALSSGKGAVAVSLVQK